MSFRLTRKEELQPDVVLGRYSDNNKSVEKTNRWNEADALFREKLCKKY
jgi:hypothetical protein